MFSATEWEAATTGSRPQLRGYNRAHYDYAFDYRTVDFDADFIDSYGPFGRTFDLFGDGSVRLAFTPGHSAGHISVILRLPRRDFVVVGDVAYTWRSSRAGRSPDAWPTAQLAPLAARAAGLPRALPVRAVVPGHDPEFWEKLEPRYEE